MVTQEQLKRLFIYNKDTGIFTYKISRYGNKVGSEAGTLDAHGYLIMSVYGKLYKLHRLAWLYCFGEFPLKHIDHINGVRDDNRIINLRIVSDAENAQNIKSNHKDSVTPLGVYYRADRNKFAAQICIKGKKYSLGCFSSIEDASSAYLKAKKNLHPFADRIFSLRDK